jgi:hypothetical protein
MHLRQQPRQASRWKCAPVLPRTRSAPACLPDALVGRYRWARSNPSYTNPLTTSFATPMMMTFVYPASVRVASVVACSIRTVLPIGSASGHITRAVAALMMPTAASEAASSGRNARPRTTGMCRMGKYSGETNV